MTTATAHETTDLAVLPIKLLRHARDAAAGEAETAAVKFVRVARRRGLTFHGLAAAVAAEVPDECRPPSPSTASPPPPPAREPLPAAWYVRLSCGRWAGSTLGHVAAVDLQYVQWLAAEFRGQAVRDAAAAVLAHVATGGRHG